MPGEPTKWTDLDVATYTLRFARLFAECAESGSTAEERQ
jgi:hypothetical protein